MNESELTELMCIQREIDALNYSIQRDRRELEYWYGKKRVLLSESKRKARKGELDEVRIAGKPIEYWL
jgi:hypothetical protein